MRVILVDDERFALIGLKKAIVNVADEIEIVATYLSSIEVIAGVLTHRPDVVFLDIHMPEIDGLQLGRQIQAAVPGIEIVFVTGYDQYAVQAFELYALDYIMKPIEKERLRQTITRLKKRLSIKSTKKPQDNQLPLILCFNEIQFQLPGKEAKTAKWRTSKAQELFAYLLHHRNRNVHRTALLELLWPDFDEDKAIHHLYTVIYYTRQTLKNCGMDMISIQNGKLEAGYRLEIGEARVDTEEWENQMKQLGNLDENNVDTYEHVLGQYMGNYFGHYDYPWAEYERERFRLLWLYHMKKLGEFYEQQGMLKKAIQTSRRIQQMLPDEEEATSH
ncbi:Transcriptional regulatory protein YehT [compost metagenome]